MKIKLIQMTLFTSIISAIDEQAKERGLDNFGATARQLNAVVKAANDIVDAMDKDDISSTPGMGLSAWLQCDDIGLSSSCMAYVLANGPNADSNHPHDADDFGRCHRFLIAVPQATSGDNANTWRAKMSMVSPTWMNLMDCWDELTALFEAKKYSELSKLIAALTP